jgi:hypothetical protein
VQRKIPLLMTRTHEWRQKNFQLSMTKMTLATPPTAASLLLSCSSMPSPLSIGTPSSYLSTCSLSLSLSLNHFPLPSYAAIQVAIVTCCCHSHQCLLNAQICVTMLFDMVASMGMKKTELKATWFKRFEHDDGSSSSQHAQYLFYLSLVSISSSKTTTRCSRCMPSVQPRPMPTGCSTICLTGTLIYCTS